MIGYLASERQYAEHLRPIWERTGGPFLERWDEDARADRWVAASVKDLRAVRDTYMDHGCGLQWHPYYNLDLIRQTRVLAPNEFLARMYRDAGIACEVVGTPKMDALLGIPPGDAIAVSVHWRFATNPGTLGAYRQAFFELAQQHEVIGHGHPRAWVRMERFWQDVGIEPVADFAEVVRRAKLYICDHSSTLYEWAALGRRVVMMQGNPYRIVESSGLRYTHHAALGPQADPRSLVEVVGKSLLVDDYEPARRAATEELYPYLGRSVARTLEVLS